MKQTVSVRKDDRRQFEIVKWNRLTEYEWWESWRVGSGKSFYDDDDGI